MKNQCLHCKLYLNQLNCINAGISFPSEASLEVGERKGKHLHGAKMGKEPRIVLRGEEMIFHADFPRNRFHSFAFAFVVQTVALTLHRV